MAGRPLTGQVMTVSSSRFKFSPLAESGTAARRGLQFRHLDLDARALSRLAFDPHAIFVAEQHLQPFVHVVYPDARSSSVASLASGIPTPSSSTDQVQSGFGAPWCESELYRPPPCC